MKTGTSTELETTPEALLERHGRELYAYLWRILADKQDAEDCLQDTFLRAVRAFKQTDADWNYRAWLYKIATNVARSHLKRARHDHQPLEGLVDQNQQDPREAILHKEKLRMVLSAMEQLSFRQRTAIMMRKYDGLAYAEIGEALDCSPESARAHVYQGLKRLRQRVENEFVGGKTHGEA